MSSTTAIYREPLSADRMKSIEDIFYSTVERFEQISTVDDVQAALRRLLSEYDLKSAAYFGINIPKIGQNEPYLAVTYSTEWVSHYKTENYVQIDPVLQQGFSSNLPVDWRQFDIRSNRLRKFFGEAKEFGLGHNGLTIPIRGRMGEQALFTITSDTPVQEWAGTLRAFMRDFQVLGFHAHQMILRSESVVEDPVKLSPREVECLKWAAAGKTVAETAIILSLADKTVRFYLDLARVKLNATNITHAVAKALRLNLISGPR